ncbi:hypothetical protein [Hymenobacter sp. BT491]|uniref:hypothetical protein n=1 Tax=Hymenobacter sp. BT491 TaxID=2766779 RepID=UPI0016538A08|nr:hypothetical protein [Hymenobacter sp. BT491]MBC6988990.1 hypothetical protein [Hymenobacter sp. BT491]
MKEATDYVREAIARNAAWECTGTGAPLLSGTCTIAAATMAVADALEEMRQDLQEGIAYCEELSRENDHLRRQSALNS